ncbi:hypothetical protein [Aliidiomarina soli]|uniref:Toxin co-regulated pilus biosynthesis protein Q C-terminal domain-containing protein n=1 Tax=Aliidiomarina soli TaxID=1928574 RepID=A0A432WL16_9GAMM|nr:hypothetical protein [Aliidiomarina soli]RUO34483.1 hypothetical protein CWE14_00245 [Aliidiomarina soli]
MHKFAWIAIVVPPMVVSPRALALSVCPPLLIPAMVAKTVAEQPLVTFRLRAGPLRPQLERLLREHLQIQQVVWKAASDQQWPSEYRLTGQHGLALVEQLATPYQLQVSLYANHIAVVRPAMENAL